MNAEPTTKELVGMLCERHPELFDKKERPWVSLTEDEKDSFLLPFGYYWILDVFEAKLKEKNGV